MGEFFTGVRAMGICAMDILVTTLWLLAGEAMNRFLNENADVIIEEMKPAAAASISRHFTGFLNKAFLKIPVDIWLTE